MRLITASQLAKSYFVEGSRPSKATVKAWLDEGLIKGKQIKGTLYVDESSFITLYHTPEGMHSSELGKKKPTIRNPILE